MYTTLLAALPGDPHLAEALESVYAQTVAPERVDVITDAGAAVPHAWRSEILDRFPGIRFRVHAGSGMASALHAGIESVTTPYVAFLDCDDLWRPQKQSFQLELLQEDEALSAVGCLAVTSVVGGCGRYSSSRMSASGKQIPCLLFTGTTFRTEAFVRFGNIDRSAGHFVWLYRWWSHARRGGIQTAYVDYVGLERRIHGGNTWVLGNGRAHSDLLVELRGLVSQRTESS